MRTTPAPPADRRLPKMRLPPPALLFIWLPSFVRVYRAPPRYAGRPAAVPTMPGNDPTIRRPRPAARGEGCRPDAAPPVEPRPAPLPAAPGDAGIHPGGRSVTEPPGRRRRP